MSNTTTTTTRIAAVGLALLLATSVLAFAPTAVAQSNQTTTTIDVTASELPDGLSGANITVAVDDASATTITDVTVSDQFDLSRSEVASDGASATFQLVDLNETVNAGASDVTLATVTVESSSEDPSLSVAHDNIDDDNGEAVSTSTLSISGLTLAGNTISDLDGDGRYEDLNGDGAFTFADVITLVFEFESVQDPALTDALDFDDDGSVTFSDVVDLVFELG
jgi:hypothetical protein